LDEIEWMKIVVAAAGLSQAEIARAADNAAKVAVLSETDQIGLSTLLAAIEERTTPVS
jgi:hypothetical protein